MLRRDAARTAITIYNFMPESGTFQRVVLRDCVWRQGNKTSRGKQGMALPDDITVLIPYSHRYFSVQSGETFTGDGWTIRMGPELEGSYIVKGVCPFLAPAPSPAPERPLILPEDSAPEPEENWPELPGAMKNWFILTLETVPVVTGDFIHDVVEPFEIQYNPRRPEGVSEHFEGSRGMWYLEVKC